MIRVDGDLYRVNHEVTSDDHPLDIEYPEGIKMKRMEQYVELNLHLERVMV